MPADCSLYTHLILSLLWQIKSCGLEMWSITPSRKNLQFERCSRGILGQVSDLKRSDSFVRCWLSRRFIYPIQAEETVRFLSLAWQDPATAPKLAMLQS
jgi:hypothetical protein